MQELAILGGPPAVTNPLKLSNIIGEEERLAVDAVMQSGILSGFYGSPGPEFFGGPQVIELESKWAKMFSVKHAISVNSGTSGLVAALGAVGIGPGDEVIVPSTTMSATAIAPLAYGAIPVFSDIEKDTFCLDLEYVESVVTPRTKAVIVVNLFGHPAQLRLLRDFCDKHNIYLIEDNAQGLLAKEDGHLAGTVGHIGVFSLNYHKHIHCGEGGICVTNSPELALRLQCLRNHGENYTESDRSRPNAFGFNWRLPELSAAVALVQLEKLDRLTERAQHIGQFFSQECSGLVGLTPPLTRKGCSHAYYVWAAKFHEKEAGISREAFSKALAAEGFPHSVGYVKPLYLLPIFQQRTGVGQSGFPLREATTSYAPGLCPVAERLYNHELILFECCLYSIDKATLGQMANAIHKVHSLRHKLVGLEL